MSLVMFFGMALLILFLGGAVLAVVFRYRSPLKTGKGQGELGLGSAEPPENRPAPAR